MDTLTHALVPYAAYTIAKAPRHHRIAAGIGGLAPDLDAVWAWLSHLHDYAYPLVHRGFSHTLLGAPLIATLLLYLLSRIPQARRWPRWANLRWSPDAIGPLWLGAFSHLALDGLTITGVPLLWPFDFTRYTTDWFFFGVPFLLPVSLIAWIQVWRRRASPRFLAVSLVLLGSLLIVAGAIRGYSYPRDLGGGEDATPGPVEWSWIVSQRWEDGVHVYETGFGGRRVHEHVFAEPNRTAAADAIRACEATVGFIPWSWSLWGIPIVNATLRPDGGWSVEYTDSGERFNELYPAIRFGLTPEREDAFDEAARCEVDPEGHAEFHRSRGWVGS